MLRILLADDHEVIRRGVRDVLQAQEGWTICGEASEGYQAVALARDLRPDVAIVDVAMPVLDGLEVTRRIGRASPATRVLMFTMHDSSELVHEALRAGAQGYILKSNPAELLVGAVAAVAAGATFSAAPRNEAVQPRRAGSAAGPPLTPREHEIAQLLAAGKTNGCVASILGISVKTVETHRTTIMQKLRLKSIVELVHYAVRNRMVTP